MVTDLTQREHEILVELITRELGELGTEIRHTDDRELREELRERRQDLRQLLERFEGVHPAP